MVGYIYISMTVHLQIITYKAFGHSCLGPILVDHWRLGIEAGENNCSKNWTTVLHVFQIKLSTHEGCIFALVISFYLSSHYWIDYRTAKSAMSHVVVAIMSRLVYRTLASFFLGAHHVFFFPVTRCKV